LRFAAPAATSLARAFSSEVDTGSRKESASKYKAYQGGLRRRSEKNMRAEVERLVEEIKQSVGLLRRHL
jgi:hypothetical protein